MKTEDLIKGLRDLVLDIQNVPDLQEEVQACRLLLRFLEETFV
jgi:hypothetical protein